MDVNVLITFFDKEDHLPYLLQILNSYKILKPTVLQVYTGTNPDVKANLKYNLPTNALDQREYSMLVEGAKAFKSVNQTKRFLKLNSNTWPLDEQKIVDIFNKLDELERPVATNYWTNNQPGSFAADIFLADTRFGNVFAPANKFLRTTELTLHSVIQNLSHQPYLIEEREPVHWRNLWECKNLKWVMYNDLQQNLNRANEFLTGQ